MLTRIRSIAAKVSPTGWTIGLVVVGSLFVAGSIFTPRIGPFTFDPFNRQAARLKDANARASTAESDAAARGLEVEGEREQAARVDTFHRQVVEIHTITAEAVSQARSAPDAEDPLEAGRAARLGDHDRRLCDLAPRSCPAAPPVDPGGG